MKHLFKKLLVIAIACLFVCSFASCDNGIKGDEAKALINDFFAAIVDEDYDKAESFLHPERPNDLETFFLNVENEKKIDFQAGIETEKYTGFSSSMYNSTVGGATYELTLRTKVGDKTVNFTIEIVKNETGYGIYNLDLNT